MQFYKGIRLDTNDDLYGYINTYHNTPHELREVYMESDNALQKIVNRHYISISIYKTIFNLSVYVVLYMGFNFIQG